MAQEVDENLLIGRAQSGDRSAFGNLYELHFDWVSKFVHSRVFNKEEARDLVQDVFVRALENIDRYNGSSPFRAWLTGIIKNVLADYFRTRRKLQEKLHHFWIDPEESVVMNEFDSKIDAQQLVRKVLDQLNDNQRQVLQLRFIQGKSVSETAQLVYGSDNDENCGKVSDQTYKALKLAYQIALLKLQRN